MSHSLKWKTRKMKWNERWLCFTISKKDFLTACPKLYSAGTQKILKLCQLKRERERQLLGIPQWQFKVECESLAVYPERMGGFSFSYWPASEAKTEGVMEVNPAPPDPFTRSSYCGTGFTINSDLESKLKTQSLVTYRMKYDTIALWRVPIADFEVTSGLLQSGNHASTRYMASLHAQKEELENQNKLQKRAAEESEQSGAKMKLIMLEQWHKSLIKEADKKAL